MAGADRAEGSGGVGRRGLLRAAAGLATLGAGGCGFHPIYGEGPAAAAGDPGIAGELAATWVAPIPERFGQLLRRGLQHRFGTVGGTPGRAKWEVGVQPRLAAEPLGILRDGTATRVRYIATANWTLTRLTPREAVASGFERALEAYDIQPNQYFAGDIGRDAAVRRLAELLADEVATRIALRFRGMRAGEPTRLVSPVETPPPMPETAPLGTVLPVEPSTGVGGGLRGGIGSGTGAP